MRLWLEQTLVSRGFLRLSLIFLLTFSSFSAMDSVVSETEVTVNARPVVVPRPRQHGTREPALPELVRLSLFFIFFILFSN